MKRPRHGDQSRPTSLGIPKFQKSLRVRFFLSWEGTFLKQKESFKTSDEQADEQAGEQDGEQTEVNKMNKGKQSWRSRFDRR